MTIYVITAAVAFMIIWGVLLGFLPGASDEDWDRWDR